jgi:23S rRNA (uracil1939-C5)-methyltransferase
VRQKKRRSTKPKVRRSLELEITELGAQGDGIATGPDGPIYVPRTVAGDKGVAQVVGNRAESFELATAGTDRRGAPCPHFDECGSCALQHLSQEAYRAHKILALEKTFRTAGLALPPISEFWGKEGSRRRATLKARGRGKGALLGYQKAGSHQLTSINTCLVLTKGLEAALPNVRQLASSILEPGEEASFALTEYENGIDISVTLDPDLYEDRRFKILAELGTAAEAFNICRITVNDEPALVIRAPAISFGGVNVSPPHDAFLQPGTESERALRTLVLDNRPEVEGGRAVDLFAGCGTFSLPLARHFDVIAYESIGAQVEALEKAAKSASLLNVKTVRRDLVREPLGDLELRKIDYAVLNPPRAGAKTQALELAKSKVSVITYISCNPGTLARDAKILHEGGYAITAVTLLDQFIYSAHSECVAIFTRPEG